jgi:SAM-dependent methyltransferase
MTAPRTFDELVVEALTAEFSGWDFRWGRERRPGEEPPWSYRQLVEARVASVTSLLDMGTGGGEFLASLSHLPSVTYATEGYAPNISIAQARLAPLGVRVIAFEDDRALPLPDQAVALVINRHESFWLPEVLRIMQPGSHFLTQQVGPRDVEQINAALGAPPNPDAARWSLGRLVRDFESAGFDVLRAEEAFSRSDFLDVGALVFFLRIIEWQIPDFDVNRYNPQLRALHARIERNGVFHALAHRYLIEARKPTG